VIVILIVRLFQNLALTSVGLIVSATIVLFLVLTLPLAFIIVLEGVEQSVLPVIFRKERVVLANVRVLNSGSVRMESGVSGGIVILAVFPAILLMVGLVSVMLRGNVKELLCAGQKVLRGTAAFTAAELKNVK